MAEGGLTPALEFAGVEKRFGGAAALSGVSLAVLPGEVHALLGENGAGKSTLGKIAAGILRPDAGEVRAAGVAVRFRSPADALARGIAMVHQELSFCPNLSVAENLALGAMPRRGRWFVDRSTLLARARAALAGVGLEVDVDRPLSSLSTAEEQACQIAQALARGVRVLILDEPTSALSHAEVERLFERIAEIKARGVACIFVSHRLAEIRALADRVSVLRDGALVLTRRAVEVSDDDVVRAMVGRDVAWARRPEAARAAGRVRLAARDLESPGRFERLSFELRAGEIAGCAGLVGSGRSELARALFGLDPAARGSVEVDGAPLRLGRPRAALAAGVALVPEDRKREGLIGSFGGRQNWSLASLGRLARRGFLDLARERAGAEAAFRELAIKAPSQDAPVALLSGGNQQKVLLARWLALGAGVLIADEPTRGVDVGARAAIHDMLVRQAEAGAAVLLISSDLEELLALASRVLVLRAGRLVGEVGSGDAAEVLRLMTGVAPEPAPGSAR